MNEAPLVERIEQELEKLRELVARTRRLLKKAQQTEDQDYLGTVALQLHSFYNGAERIFVEIAKAIDASVPTGTDWHVRLLKQMSVEIPNVRPPMISKQTYSELDEFRSFRHVVRSIYAYELEPERVVALAEKLVAISQHLIQDTQEFCTELKRRSQLSDQNVDQLSSDES